MTDFKFLHVADIHLDSPLAGLARYEGIPVDEVRLATREALTKLVDFAIEERLAFVVIAGDIYDGNWQDFGTGLFFCAAMGKLERAGIDVYLLYGNHDAESVLTKKLPLPPNVHVFPSNKATTFIHTGTGTALHGRSYKDKDTRDNLATQYPSATVGVLNIGVLHTALGGRPPHASYAPCALPELVAKGYDYWALGHVHNFEVVSASPYIVFSGNIQGRSIRECGPKGAVVVTVQDGAITEAPTHLAFDSVRWAVIEVDVSSADNESQLHSLVRDALLIVSEEEDDEHPLIVRVSLRGKTSLHGTLLNNNDQLQHDVHGIAIAISEKLWIEKVAVKTAAPESSPALDGQPPDDLSSLFTSGIADAELQKQLEIDLADFLARLPSNLEAGDELLSSVRNGSFATLLSDAATALASQFESESL